MKGNIKNIVIGNYYRKSNTPNYGWAKVLKILPACTGKNNNKYPVAECEWTISKNDKIGLIKYFKLSDLIIGK